jgi:hypothetical protein
LFWKSFWESFWKSFWWSFWETSSFFSTLLSEEWISKKDKQSMTTSLIDVCVCLIEKNEISSIFVDLVFFIFCWRIRQFLFRASWDFHILRILFWWWTSDKRFFNALILRIDRILKSKNIDFRCDHIVNNCSIAWFCSYEKISRTCEFRRLRRDHLQNRKRLTKYPFGW